jgi:hypothetical protein
MHVCKMHVNKNMYIGTYKLVNSNDETWIQSYDCLIYNYLVSFVVG